MFNIMRTDYRIIQREGSVPNGFLSQTLGLVTTLRSTFYQGAASNPQKWDVVLLGAFLYAFNWLQIPMVFL